MDSLINNMPFVATVVFSFAGGWHLAESRHQPSAQARNRQLVLAALFFSVAVFVAVGRMVVLGKFW